MLRTKTVVISVVLVSAMMFSACKPKTAQPVDSMSDAGQTQIDTSADSLNSSPSSTVKSGQAQTPEQEVDAAIKEMDAAVNTNAKNEFKSSDFNF